LRFFYEDLVSLLDTFHRAIFVMSHVTPDPFRTSAAKVLNFQHALIRLPEDLYCIYHPWQPTLDPFYLVRKSNYFVTTVRNPHFLR